MIWEGPRATTAYPGPHGTIEVVFNTSAGLMLNTSAACPHALRASPLGRMYLLRSILVTAARDEYQPLQANIHQHLYE